MKIKRFKSFGLVEVVVAIGILTLVIGSTATFGMVTTRGVIKAKHKTEAYHLAQDAMEQIKGKRDEIWLSNNPISWEDFWQNEFPQLENRLNKKCVFINHSSAQLLEDDCNSGHKGLKFQRRVQAQPLPSQTSPQVYQVTVAVSWEDYGRSHTVSIISRLTNWQPRY